MLVSLFVARIEFLMNNHPPMVCPVCKGPTRPALQKHGYWIEDCIVCGHRCAAIEQTAEHVDRVYGDNYFNGGEAGYPDYLADGDLLIAHGRHYAKAVQRYMPVGTVLDVGAAAGFILRGFQDEGWRGAGVEPNPAMAAHARECLGLRVVTSTFEQFDGDEQFDLISMIQVVPHFFDVRRALQVATAHTRDHGFWLIETWNRESLSARMAGKSWHEYSPPSVLHWFTPRTLARLAGQFGMCEVARWTPRQEDKPGSCQNASGIQVR